MKSKHFSGLEISFFILLLVFGLMLLGSLTVKSRVSTDYLIGNSEEMIPTASETAEDGSVTYTFSGYSFCQGRDGIVFYSTNQEVYLYVDGKLAYSREGVSSIFGHTTGSTWNLYTVPDGAHEITVTYVPIYQSAAIKTTTFLLGDGHEIILEKIRGSFISLLVCLFIIVVGIAMFIYWIMTREFSQDMKDLVYLGVFAVMLGAWSIGETDAVQILLTNRVAGTFAGFGCILFLGPSAILFAHFFFKPMDKYVYRIMTSYCLAVGAFAFAAQALNLCDFREIAPLIQSVMPVGVIYWIYALVMLYIRRTDMRKAVVNTIGMVILLNTVGYDLVKYYQDRSQANHTVNFGFLVYILILGIETGRYTREHMEEQRNLKFYREMATKDMLTGCYNRNAYDEDLKRLDSFTGIGIAAFDLNCLKECNDHYGHAVGDQYLVDSARIIKSVFGKQGKIYRTGGDEFCCIVMHANKNQLKDLMKRMAQSRTTLEDSYPELSLAIASGFAIFDEKQDGSLSDTIRRADEKMYGNKKDLKAKTA